MKVDIYLPPACDSDLGNVSGWLLRCKPEHDCASLFSLDDTLPMGSSIDEVICATFAHVIDCEEATGASHAVVAVCNGSTHAQAEGA